MPVVSILMTSYNREAYIGQAIESVIQSSFQDFELIIVDDGSRDRTVEIAKQYQGQDKRIHVYINEKNLGDYPNRNKAASYATGKYIKYLDADDAFYSWGLEAEVGMMESHPEAAYGLDSVEQDDLRIYPYVLKPSEAYYAYYAKRQSIFDRAPTSCIIKRDVFEQLGGFKPLLMVGDCEMWHRISLHHNLLVMPYGIIWARGHAESESGKWMTNPFILYHYMLIRRGYLLLKNCPLEKSIRLMMVRSVARQQAKLLIKCIIKFNFKAYWEIRQIDQITLFQLVGLTFYNG